MPTSRRRTPFDKLEKATGGRAIEALRPSRDAKDRPNTEKVKTKKTRAEEGKDRAAKARKDAIARYGKPKKDTG